MNPSRQPPLYILPPPSNFLTTWFHKFDRIRIWDVKKQLIKAIVVNERHGSFWVQAKLLQRILSCEQLAVMLFLWQSLCGIYDQEKAIWKWGICPLLPESFLIVPFFLSCSFLQRRGKLSVSKREAAVSIPQDIC